MHITLDYIQMKKYPPLASGKEVRALYASITIVNIDVFIALPPMFQRKAIKSVLTAPMEEVLGLDATQFTIIEDLNRMRRELPSHNKKTRKYTLWINLGFATESDLIQAIMASPGETSRHTA